MAQDYERPIIAQALIDPTVAIFSQTVTDILAARLKTSALPQGSRIIVADWIIETAEQLNPRFDRKRFLKLSGLLAPDTEHRQHT